MYSPVQILNAKNAILGLKRLVCKGLKWSEEALEDPKHIINVKSAVLDSSENTTLVHTNQVSRGYIHLYEF